MSSKWESNSNLVFGKENKVVPDSRKQNEWTVCAFWDLEDKWYDVKNHIKKSTAGNIDTLWVNYFSASTEGGCDLRVTPSFVASGHTGRGDDSGRLFLRLWSENDKPYWYTPFPRTNCTGGDTSWDTCKVHYEGINVLAEQCIRGWPLNEDSEYKYEPRYLCDNKSHINGRLGLVYMDFPDYGLIGAIIKTNAAFENNIHAGGSYIADEGTFLTLDGCILNIERSIYCLTSYSDYWWDLDGDGLFETNHRYPLFDVSDNKTVVVTLSNCTNVGCPDMSDPAMAFLSYIFGIQTDTAKVIVESVPPRVVISQEPSDLLTTNVALHIKDSIKDMEAGININFTWGDSPWIQFNRTSSPLLTHEYQKSGKYIMNVTASDKDNEYSYNNTGIIATPFVLLLDHIDDLVNDGTLNIEEGNFSTSRLDTILDHIDNGTYVHGCVVADVFIHEFNIFGNSALITQTEWGSGLAHIESQKTQIGCNG